ncbi:hypothetical protein [Janthinobacterium sp. ZB1P44]|uniref:hypothetical protein n=1 Tax=Janthinobacterium sp. ZB1P44 TaxID=3424192 RepID=UPI003F1F3CE1
MKHSHLLAIERSAEGQFAADRETIVAQMRDMATKGKPPHQLPLVTDAHDGVEVLGLNNAGIAQTSGMLHAASGTVATAYILSQPADPRDFATDAQYQALRNQLIASLARCMADPAR